MQTAIARAEQRPFPLPSDIPAALARSVFRAATAAVLNEMRPQPGGPAGILQAAWPSDRIAVAIVTRTATVPATTSASGWADTLATTTTGGFLSSLGIASAAAQLFGVCSRLSLDGTSQIKLTYASATPSLAPSFVVEGAPIPLRQGALATLTVGPTKKMAVLAAMTNDLADHSTPAAELVVRQVVTESAAKALDSYFFSAAAAGAGPGGILAGVSSLTPTAITGGPLAAAAADIANMLDAIAAAGGGREVLIFASPGRAAKLGMLAPGLQLQVIPAPSLAAADIVAIDAGGVASAYGGDPLVETGSETLLHFEDTTPLQISTGAQGSGVLATPTRSMFQTDSVGLRLILRCAWAARSGYVQLVSGCLW